MEEVGVTKRIRIHSLIVILVDYLFSLILGVGSVGSVGSPGHAHYFFQRVTSNTGLGESFNSTKKFNAFKINKIQKVLHELSRNCKKQL